VSEPLDFDYIKLAMKVCDAEEQLCDMADEDRAARGPQGEILDPRRGPQGEDIWWG
jgi:hypothetical protein